MAVEDTAGAGGASSIAEFLRQVQLYLSIAGLVIQVWLTSRSHRYLGVGFAILILPLRLGATGGLILVTGTLSSAVAGRVVDAALRYTVDKTTREVLFLPLPPGLRRQAKPFVDVTVDRFAKGLLAGLGERDERGSAESEFAASSAEDEPLDPASSAGRLDEQVQAVAVGVASWRGGTDEGGRERLVGMASSALGSPAAGAQSGSVSPRNPVSHSQQMTCCQ